MPQRKADQTTCFQRLRWRGAQALLLLTFGFSVSLAGPAVAGAVKYITTYKELVQAVRKAQPGDVITLAPGTYKFSRKIKLNRPGKKNAPIVLRAAKLGEVRIKGGGVAFNISSPYWIVENLDIAGECEKDDWCEHAFHIFGNAQGVIIRGNRLHEYNAMIKMNGTNSGPAKKGQKRERIYPNDVLIENNIFFNSAVRNTANPVTPIDVVGGRRAIIRGNLIADFAKSSGNRVSYGAFLKGMSREGTFERNLVICELAHSGHIRIGLSFGGGGTGKGLFDKPVGRTEHLDGIMRNNIIMNCPNEVGIYLNKSTNTKVYNNTLYNTYGIDVRFKETTADIRNNIMTGGIRQRDGGTSTEADNLIVGLSYSAWYPAIARYVKGLLDGQDREFSGHIDKSDVEFVQSLVDGALALVASTWLGNGSNSLEALFGNPVMADFSLREPDRILDKGQVLRDVRYDFCGHPRQTPPHDLGAIEYGEKRCDVVGKFRDAIDGIRK